MAWWKLFWNQVEDPQDKEEVLEIPTSIEKYIREPVRCIVDAMIVDRKRFIFQVEHSFGTTAASKYSVMDIDTGEEFFVGSCCDYRSYSLETYYSGPSWANSYELEWAVQTLYEHFNSITARAKRIKTIRERNRLIEIYA